ncbi:DUF6300 family protein [Streptomyces sp. NPDC058254]|uniref:DUF6300 family protein n=1 Tax=Streptomyces sp. NPDC058254 TaxID=3346406 RepID=UPI0036E668CC
MARIFRTGRLPQCSRCRADLTISAVAPKNDAAGRPIHLELCPSCDSGDPERPAAGLLVQFFADGGGRDTARAEEGARLMAAWTKECMASHGWHWRPDPHGDGM